MLREKFPKKEERDYENDDNLPFISVKCEQFAAHSGVQDLHLLIDT